MKIKPLLFVVSATTIPFAFCSISCSSNKNVELTQTLKESDSQYILYSDKIEPIKRGTSVTGIIKLKNLPDVVAWKEIETWEFGVSLNKDHPSIWIESTSIAEATVYMDGKKLEEDDDYYIDKRMGGRAFLFHPRSEKGTIAISNNTTFKITISLNDNIDTNFYVGFKVGRTSPSPSNSIKK